MTPVTSMLALQGRPVVRTSGSRPTLSEVARLAGVSISTTSRVMRADPRVAPKTRARVQQVADLLGMRVNTMASSLRNGGRAAIVGVVVPDVSDPFFAALTFGVETAMLRVHQRIVLGCHRDSPVALAELLDGMLGDQISALVVVPAPGTDPELLTRETRLGTPIVLVDRPVPGFAADTVLCANRAGGAMLVDTLVGGGHRRIAVVGLDHRIWTQDERRRGIDQAMASHGLSVPPAWHAELTRDGTALHDIVTGWLQSRRPPTAILATSTPPLIPAIVAARQSGLDVEFGVFDADPVFELLDESIHVVAQSPRRAGAVAAEMVIERLGGLASPARRVELPVVAVQRTVPSLTRRADR